MGRRADEVFHRDGTKVLDAPAVAAIEQELDAIADEVVSAIQASVPEYAKPLRGEFGRAIRVGTAQALRRFVRGADDESGEIYRRLGRAEHRAGRSLDALQSAYRVGARIAWRRMSRLAAAGGAPSHRLQDLAEAMFAYIDQLAAESVDGYADAQLAEAGDIERRRSALLSLLLGQPPAAAETLAGAAVAAEWEVPRSLACLVVGGGSLPVIAGRFSGPVLRGVHAGCDCVVVSNPTDLAGEARAAAARGSVALAVGPTVPPSQAYRSFRWARMASQVAAQPAGVVVAEEHLGKLALAAAPDVTAALASRALEPLADETARSRDRLAQTLRAWLDHRGSYAAMAAELKIHPQTVRYRVHRLRELYGAALDDPERRFELHLALRAPRGG